MPLQDSDNFIIGRGTDSYKITYQDLKDDLNYVPPPVGTINTPTVTEPNDGAGGGDTRYLKSDAITDVEGSGVDVCETDQISSVLILSGLGVAATSHTTHDVTSTLNDANFNKAGKNLSAGTSFLNVVGDRHAWTKMEFADPSPLAISPSGRAAVGGYTRVNVFGSETGNSGDWIHITTLSYGNTAGGTNGDQTPVKEVPTTKGIFKFYALCFNNQNVTSPDQTPANYGGTFHYTFQQVSDYGTELTFPTSNGFDCFEPGDVVQDPDVKIISKDADAVPPTITVDGGDWFGSSDTSAGSDQSEQWSNDVSGAHTVAGLTAETMFDGVYLPGAIANNRGGPIPAENNSSYVWLANGKFPDAKKVTIWYYASNPPTPAVEVNGNPVTVLNQTVTSVDIDVTGDGLNRIESFSGDDKDFNYTLIKAVFVDDVLLLDPTGQTKLTKETLYNTKLTVAGSTDLADMTGAVLMTDGTGAPGPYSQTPYKLVTTDIESVSNNKVIYDGSGISMGSGAGPASAFVNGDITTVGPSGLSYFRSNKEVAGMDTWGITFSAPSVTTITKSLKLYFSTTQRDGGEVYINKQATGTIVPINSGQIIEIDVDLSRFALPLDLTNINVLTTPDGGSNSGPAYYIAGFRVDGAVVTAGEPLGNITLTFPGDVSTNPDLQYFQAGDAVQQIGDKYSEGSAFANCFNPNTAITDWAKQNNLNIFYEANAPVTAFEATASQIVVPDGHYLGQRVSVSGNYDIEIEFASGNTASKNISNASSKEPKTYYQNTSGETQYITKITFVGGSNNVGLQNFYVTNTEVTNQGTWETYAVPNLILDSSDFGFASVISTGYPDSNSMAVDGGEWLGTDGSATDGVDLGWNQSETWTDYATNANFSKVFDGNDATYVANIGNPVTYTYTGKLTGKVEVTIGNFKNLLGSGETYELNSSGNVVTISPTEFDVWKEIGTLDDEAMSITITGLSGNSALISGIKVDGQRLVDPTIAGAPNPIGDNHVEYQTNGGQGDIVSVNTDDNTLVIKDTGDRDNRWIKGFSVAGPTVIDTPLLTNDVELRGSDFATTPADADTLKEIVWSINGTEYSAGVTNPWSPLEKLPTNSTVTVKVKYKGNTLEDSDWSPDVTFTTGSTMRSLFSRIAALEANDVTDDATDTALLTLIAGLAARIQALEESN